MQDALLRRPDGAAVQPARRGCTPAQQAATARLPGPEPGQPQPAQPGAAAARARLAGQGAATCGPAPSAQRTSIPDCAPARARGRCHWQLHAAGDHHTRGLGELQQCFSSSHVRQSQLTLGHACRPATTAAATPPFNRASTAASWW